MEKVRWRGTWGIGDSMNALNVCHNYAWSKGIKVNLEMHWSHDENHLETPKDPETIVQRTDWIHTQYHRQDDVVLTHVFNSDLFPKGNMNSDSNKIRQIFDSGHKEPFDNDWIFKPESFTKKKKKIVIWTHTYNTKKPRTWKRFLTNDDWYDIIKLLSWEGWDTVELTYRTPIRDAFKQISEADFVVCYDGMWHYIARNFGKPMFIPSWEGVTHYNTPNAVRRPIQLNVEEWPPEKVPELITKARKEVMDWFGSDGKEFELSMNEMKIRSKKYLNRIKKKYHED
jgi:hypothetical protein